MTGGRISSVDFASTGDYLQHYRLGSSQDHHRRADMSASNAVIGLDATASGVGPADSTEKNPSDGAESDEKSASVEDPDVFAPSDTTYNPSQSQTGLHTTTTHKSETESIAAREGSCSGAKLVSAEGATISDEDDYTGVDLISESGDEEPIIDSLEGKAAIDSEGDDADADGAHPRSPPNSPYDAFSFTSGQIDFDLDPFLTDDIFFKEQINILDHHEGAIDTDFFASPNNIRFASPLAETPRRRVRFADPLMLPSEASKLLSTDLDSGRIFSAQLGGDTLNKNNEHADTEHKSCNGHVGTGDGAMRSTARVGDINTFDVFEPMNSDDDQEDNDEDTDSSVGSSSGYESRS